MDLTFVIGKPSIMLLTAVSSSAIWSVHETAHSGNKKLVSCVRVRKFILYLLLSLRCVTNCYLFCPLDMGGSGEVHCSALSGYLSNELHCETGDRVNCPYSYTTMTGLNPVYSTDQDSSYCYSSYTLSPYYTSDYGSSYYSSGYGYSHVTLCKAKRCKSFILVTQLL